MKIDCEQLFCDALLGAEATLTLNGTVVSGHVRAVGEAVEMALPGSGESSELRQVVVDFGTACAPVELWLAEDRYQALQGDIGTVNGPTAIAEAMP